MKKIEKISKIRCDMVDNITYISCPFYFNFENMQQSFPHFERFIKFFLTDDIK